MNKLILVCAFLTSISLLRVSAQVTPTITPATDTIKLVDILHADRLRFIKPDSSNELTIAAGNVSFRDGTTLFYADSVVHNRNKQILEAFGNVHINDADSIHTYSQYLIYYVDRKFAVLK